MKNSKKGFKRIIWAFLFSLAGLKVCFKEEWAFRVVVLCFIIFGFLAYFLAHDFVEFTLLCLPLFLMVFAEIANTAIEKIIDLVSPDFHPLAREATVCLSTGSPKEVCLLGMTPTTSTTVMTVMGDILVVQTMKLTGFTMEDYAKRHHGGYLGEKSRSLCEK